MLIFWYLSSHGFGHATRDIEVINEIGRRRPDIRIVVRTAAPAWFLRANLRVAADLQHAETDTGVVQVTSLQIDEPETARQAAAFHAGFDARVEAEAGLLRRAGATVVVSDIPPLACTAAARADVPAIALANFTWDWIYAGFPDFDRIAPGVIAAIGRAYATVTHALRLPLHGGFGTVSGPIVDLPLIARRSRRDREETRRALGLGSDRPVVLGSFGGHGLALDYDAIAAANAFHLVVTDVEQRQPAHTSRLTRLTARDLADRGLRYEDLVAAADVVVSKPGYGIVSECIANGAALLYTSRGRFPEQDVLEREMPALLRCAPIALDDLIAGRWRGAIDRVLAQPPPAAVPTNGAEVAAAAILRIASGRLHARV